VSLPAPLAAAVERATGRAPRAAARVGGGDINEAWRVELDGDVVAFVKTRPDAPAGEYGAEAAGLAWLAEPGGLPIPEVLGVADDPAWPGDPAAPGDPASPGDADAPAQLATPGDPASPRLLALAWIDEGDRRDSAALGRGLATIHAAGAPAFGGGPAAGGVTPPLRLGAVVLPNEPLPDWPSFYAERRLLPLLALARDRGALSAAGAQAVERVCDRLPDLAGPPEPPARLHGDLWSGNVLWDRNQRPWLIDPAAYGGHREGDLAMLALFGTPGPQFLAAYEEAHPLADGHAQRVPLWQLLPLLVHAVLFGGSYGAAAERAARRY
jgi:fructosamine-3-kinase